MLRAANKLRVSLQQPARSTECARMKRDNLVNQNYSTARLLVASLLVIKKLIHRSQIVKAQTVHTWGTSPIWTFYAQSWSSAISKVLVPVSWEFLRTESYFPLKEGTKLHFSSTWTPGVSQRTVSPNSVRGIRSRLGDGRQNLYHPYRAWIRV